MMNDLALDPSETRRAPDAARQRAAGRRWTRIALFGVLGVAGTGAFASAASTYLSGLAGPQRAPLIVIGRKAADWPDLKDGLPALATGGGSTVPKIREILPPEPVAPPVVEARIEPNLRAASSTVPEAVAPPPAAASKAETSVAAPKPLPAIVNVPVIGPARQAILVPPARTVPGIPPLAGETVRAKTGNATYAALPPENPGGIVVNPVAARDEATKPDTAKAESPKPETSRAKPRIDAHAKPQASKPVAEKPAARKPAAVEANAAPADARAQDEDTEVFGIKVPSFAPAGRKLRESVEALGDAVKGIPDRF